MQERREKVKAIIAKILEIEEAEVTDDLVFGESENIEFDSIAALDILANIEKKFKIKIPESYLPKLISLDSIEKVIDEISSQK